MQELSLHQSIKHVKRGCIIVQEGFDAGNPVFGLICFLVENKIDSEIAKEFSELKALSELSAQTYYLLVGKRLLGKGAGSRLEGLG